MMRDRSEAERVFPVPWATELGVAAFFLIAVIVLLVRPDLDPVGRYISEYAVGSGGWAMRTAFVLLGLASLNLVPGFLDGTRIARRVAWALALWGVAVLVAAAFPVDLQGTAVTATGVVHLAAAAVGFVALFGAMGLAVRAFRASVRWQDLARPTRWAAIMTPTTFLLEASVFTTLGWVGVGQWLLFGLAGGWILAVGRRFRRVEGGGGG